MTESNAAMTALVEYQVRTDEVTTDEWLEVWQSRAQDALVAEPETAGYAAAVSLEDESCLFFYEHYINGLAGLKVHMERTSHSVLTETMAARRMTKRRVMSTGFYDLPDFGWRGRDEKTLICRDAVISLLGMRFSNDATRREFLSRLVDDSNHCFTEQPDTLIYRCGIAERDADRGPDIKQGDVLFFKVCTDLAAAESRDSVHLALQQPLSEAGEGITPTFQKLYRTTGNGFLTKTV